MTRLWLRWPSGSEPLTTLFRGPWAMWVDKAFDSMRMGFHISCPWNVDHLRFCPPAMDRRVLISPRDIMAGRCPPQRMSRGVWTSLYFLPRNEDILLEICREGDLKTMSFITCKMKSNENLPLLWANMPCSPLCPWFLLPPYPSTRMYRSFSPNSALSSAYLMSAASGKLISFLPQLLKLDYRMSSHRVVGHAQGQGSTEVIKIQISHLFGILELQ